MSGWFYAPSSASSSSPAVGVDTTAATYAAARLLSGVTTGDRLSVLGRTSKSDGGQGLFTWVAGGATSINDGFELAAPGGIWRRADTSLITYEMFGAVAMTSFADTSHDSTAAINACHAALPSLTTAPKPCRVVVQGLYGISATINVHETASNTFEGFAQFGEIGSGYVWIVALDNTKHMLHLRGNRLSKWKNLRVTTNTQTATRANAMKSAICLSSDHPTAIQQRLLFQDMWIGNRDLYDGLGSASGNVYQFIAGFGTETLVSGGNNDVHTFNRINFENIGKCWDNQDGQSVGWVARDCKVVQSDTVYAVKSCMMTFYNIEADSMQAASFLFNGIDGTDSPVVRVYGYISQTNFAEFAILNTGGTLIVEHAQFDHNCNPANVAVVNPANPYFITCPTAANALFTLDECRFFAIPPVIDFGTSAALRGLTVRGGHPDTIAIRNTGTGMGQDQRIYFHWEPSDHQSGLFHLTDPDWAPFDQLIYPPYNLVPDYTTRELMNQTVRCGRRNVSACTDIISVATSSPDPVPAGPTYTFAGALPIGLILGVSLHIRSIPGGVPASINIGDGTTAARWGNKTNVSGSTFNPPEASAVAAYTDTAPFYNKAVGNVVLTGVGGSFPGTGHEVTITVHYINFAQRFYNPNASG